MRALSNTYAWFTISEIFCSKPSVPTNTVIISDVPRRAELGSILQTACYDVMTNITCVNHEVWNATLPICQGDFSFPTGQSVCMW